MVFCVASFSAGFLPQPPEAFSHQQIQSLIFFDSVTQFLKVRDSSLGATERLQQWPNSVD